MILLDSHSESDPESSASEQQLEEMVVETTEIMVRVVESHLCHYSDTLCLQVECDESESLIESTKLGMIEDRFPKDWCSIALRMTKGDVSLAADFLEKADTLLIGSDPCTHSNPEQVHISDTLRHIFLIYLP